MDLVNKFNLYTIVQYFTSDFQKETHSYRLVQDWTLFIEQVYYQSAALNQFCTSMGDYIKQLLKQSVWQAKQN